MKLIPPFIMFPEPSAVFADRVSRHSKFLFPLFSIDLAAINPEWTGRLHMLQFNEDIFNRDAIMYFNEYCRDGMIGFDVIGNKYSFKSNLRYFELTKGWSDAFEKTKESFQKTRKLFLKFGTFPASLNSENRLFEQIGGNPVWSQSDETPLDPAGLPMTFIAKVRTSNYTDDHQTKDIYLFYSDSFKIAVLLYQRPKEITVTIINIDQ